MANAATKRDANLFKDILVEAVAGAFAGKQALNGTGVAMLRPNLPMVNPWGGKMGTGNKIQIPYFDSVGELEDVVEGSALTPRLLSSTQEESSIVHSGLAGEVTAWAELAAQAGDPYEEFARQFVEAAMRRIDTGLIVKASATTLTLDSGGASITEDWIVKASELWSDELDDNDGVRLIVVHPTVRKNMRLLKDSTGRRLYVEGSVSPTGVRTLPTFCGYPVRASARLTPTGNVYPTLLCKRNAMAAWYNGDPIPDTDRDILADSDVTAVHLYHVEHLYKRPANGTLPGVVKLTTTES